MTKQLKVGTILVHSIGSGCNQYYQVVKSSPKFVTARQLESIVTKRNIKFQTHHSKPDINNFVPEDQQYATVRLKLSDDGRIGPIKRMMWWSVWDEKSLQHYSP